MEQWGKKMGVWLLGRGGRVEKLDSWWACVTVLGEGGEARLVKRGEG